MMLGTLLKKQLMEIFRGYFYDTRKNKARSKAATIGLIVLFLVLSVGMLGGMFYSMAAGLSGPLVNAGLGWLYFAMVGLLAVFVGVLGSAFTTYSGLYLAKDNDLLLSMPIPVRTIVAARAFSVYLMGLFLSAVVVIPALIAYGQIVPPTASTVLGGTVFLLLVSAIVLVLSCLLGYGVARLSVKLKNKSWITTILALVFLGIYYAFYFKGMELLQDFILHLDEYTGKIGAKLSFLKAFGEVGEGKISAILISAAVVFILCAAVWTVLMRSFTKIATADRSGGKAVYREKAAKERGVLKALESKEFGRFIASSNYMLNCGLTVVFLPVIGILLLVKGREVLPAVETVFSQFPGLVLVLLVAVICSLASMVDIVVPSVSLEGNMLWITQTLPVGGSRVLLAKVKMHLLLAAPLSLISSAVIAVILSSDIMGTMALVITPLCMCVFEAMLGLTVNLKSHRFDWINEVEVIKRGAAVGITLGVSFGAVIVPALLYLILLQWFVGVEIAMFIYSATLLIAAGIMYKKIKDDGDAKFAEL